MWELDCEESWVPKNWCFWTVVLEKTLESPLDCKEIQPVHPRGDHSWMFIGRTDAKTETPVLWSPHAKSWTWLTELNWGQIRKASWKKWYSNWFLKLTRKRTQDGKEEEGQVTRSSSRKNVPLYLSSSYLLSSTSFLIPSLAEAAWPASWETYM